MKKLTMKSVFFNGLITENPTLRLLLGMCPTLAISTAVSNGIGMGLATTVVLMFSNLAISLLRHVIPEKVRIPAFVVIIATFVTIVDLLIKAFLPALSSSLGLYIPLIVVNCIIFARAEAFAFKNAPLLSLADGLGMGLGFTCSITILSALREVIGNGTLFGMQVLPESIPPLTIISRPPGGFIMLGLLLIAVNAIIAAQNKRKLAKEKEENV